MWSLVFVAMGMVVVDGRTLIAETERVVKGPYLRLEDCNKDLQRVQPVINNQKGRVKCAQTNFPKEA
jgi:hypothetical protein